MGKALRWGLAVAVMTLIGPSMGSAQNVYVAVRGGPNSTSDVRIGPPGREQHISFDLGFTGSAAVGYASAWGLRFEGEVGYIFAPVTREEGQPINGSIQSYLAMVNLYYDLKLGAVKPYVGLGFGAARVGEVRQTIFTIPPARADIDEWRTTFAYQARAGLSYEVSKWLDLSAGYRYVHVSSGSRDGTIQGFIVNAEGMDNHSLEVGIAIKF